MGVSKIGKGDAHFNWFKILQKILGFLVGFFFSGLALDRVIGFFQAGTGELPSAIPTWLNLVLAGGTVGIIIFLILIILGIRIVTKFIPFFIWLLIGVLAAIIVNTVFPAFNIPNPFSWILQRIGGG